MKMYQFNIKNSMHIYIKSDIRLKKNDSKIPLKYIERDKWSADSILSCNFRVSTPHYD